MTDSSEEDNEISFPVKFLGRVEVVRPDGLQVLSEAVQGLKGHTLVSLSKTPNPYLLPGQKCEKAMGLKCNTPQGDMSKNAAKKSKVLLFLSRDALDVLEKKTKYMLYTCPLSTVSFCAVLPSSPKVFGFVARHPAADASHCYVFQSRALSHVLVSAIGEAFRASRKEEGVGVGRDLIVEALRLKNKMLQRENAELKDKLANSKQ